MDLVFPQGKSVEISFKVGIAGTAAPAQSVFVSLARDGKITSFTAFKNIDEYKAIIEYPGYLLGIGEVDFSINVKVNDRIFTPFKSTANVVAAEPVMQLAPEIVPEIAIEPTPEVAVEQTVEPIVIQQKSEVPKVEEIKPPKKSLMKMIEPKMVVPIQPKILKPKVNEDVPKFSVKKLKVIFK